MLAHKLNEARRCHPAREKSTQRGGETVRTGGASGRAGVTRGRSCCVRKRLAHRLGGTTGYSRQPTYALRPIATMGNSPFHLKLNLPPPCLATSFHLRLGVWLKGTLYSFIHIYRFQNVLLLNIILSLYLPELLGQSAGQAIVLKMQPCIFFPCQMVKSISRWLVAGVHFGPCNYGLELRTLRPFYNSIHAVVSLYFYSLLE